MVGALAKTLCHLGHEVGIISPLYAGIKEGNPSLELLSVELQISLGYSLIPGGVWYLRGSAGERLYFLQNDHFFNRPNYYAEQGQDYPDNDARFIFFSKAVAHLAQNLEWKPEIMHVHDWQVGLVPLFIRDHLKRGLRGNHPATILTLHNLAYQGVFPESSYALTELPLEYFRFDSVEFYGQMNCLKSGIVFADLLTTVSPRYSREILSEEFGCGLEGALRMRQNQLTGILNGVDYSEWNTHKNKSLVAAYSLDDLRGKSANKLAVQAELELSVREDVPLFGIVSRLTDQKGVDICLGALEVMLEEDIQFALLGSGQPEFEASFLRLAAKHSKKVAIHIGYNQGLAHRIEAGSDFFLMPSRFEPCGLNQMYSLKYGTIPIVRAVGGLDDSIIDASDDKNHANGIKFDEYSVRALVESMRKALVIHADPERLSFYRRNGMGVNFDWEKTAKEYIRAYERAIDSIDLT